MFILFITCELFCKPYSSQSNFCMLLHARLEVLYHLCLKNQGGGGALCSPTPQLQCPNIYAKCPFFPEFPVNKAPQMPSSRWKKAFRLLCVNFSSEMKSYDSVDVVVPEFWNNKKKALFQFQFQWFRHWVGDISFNSLPFCFFLLGGSAVCFWYIYVSVLRGCSCCLV